MYVKKHRVLLISLLSAVLLTTGTFSVSTSKAFADSLNPPPVPVSDSPSATSSSPVAAHGNLHVDGPGLTDCHGEKYQLRGMSTHGIAWFPQYITLETFCTLRDDWNTNCIRLAMYTEEYNGYCSGGNQDELKALIQKGVDYATGLGMYVILDWHVLNDRDPNVHKTEALAFFQEMSSLYKNHKNVLYEICNEPNSNVTWDSIKSYAREVIPVIRANDPDAVIIVGTPTWSQDIHQAVSAPLEYENILYALHFYAATHTDWLRQRLEACIAQGLPVFVSEFGTCDASGNGSNDFQQAAQWLDLLDNYSISYCCWNLANKAEASSVISPDCKKISGWSLDELSESGKWIFEQFRSRSLY